jgi:peptide/nickel transport system substrate-binding protein
VLVVALLGACAIMGSEVRPSTGGRYREGLVGQPLSLNPLLHPTDPIVRDISSLVYAGLVRVHDAGEIQPDLASSWTSNDDGLTYTFELRRSVWHDGQAVTAQDVAATIALVHSPTFQGPTELTEAWRGVQVEAVDRDTVRFRLPQTLAGFIEMCSLPILPAHLIGADGLANLVEHPASYKPVGAGPFKVESVDATGIVLSRHEGYGGKRPFLAEIEFRYFPDLASARDALVDGAIDGLSGISHAEAQALPAEKFAIHEAPLQGHETILWLNQRNPILADPAVRRAIAATVDRSALVAGPLQGQAVPAYGPVAAYSWAYREEIERDPDLAAAGRLLNDAGWVGTLGRTRAGRELRLQLAVAADDQQIAVAQLLAGQMAQAGIRVDLQPMALVDFYRDHLLPRQYDLALLGAWQSSVDPDPYPFWHSSQAERGFNFASYANPTVDDLLSTARTDGDPTRRFAALSAFQQLWIDDAPSVILYSPLLSYAVSSEVKGVRLGITPEPAARFQHLVDWYERTSRVPALAR